MPSLSNRLKTRTRLLAIALFLVLAGLGLAGGGQRHPSLLKSFSAVVPSGLIYDTHRPDDGLYATFAPVAAEFVLEISDGKKFYGGLKNFDKIPLQNFPGYQGATRSKESLGSAEFVYYLSNSGGYEMRGYLTHPKAEYAVTMSRSTRPDPAEWSALIQLLSGLREESAAGRSTDSSRTYSGYATFSVPSTPKLTRTAFAYDFLDVVYRLPDTKAPGLRCQVQDCNWTRDQAMQLLPTLREFADRETKVVEVSPSRTWSTWFDHLGGELNLDGMLEDKKTGKVWKVHCSGKTTAQDEETALRLFQQVLNSMETESAPPK